VSVSETDAPVEIVPYDASWPIQFDTERLALAAAIGEWLVGPIEHIGKNVLLNARVVCCAVPRLWSSLRSGTRSDPPSMLVTMLWFKQSSTHS
jgi:hypothetical protein